MTVSHFEIAPEFIYTCIYMDILSTFDGPNFKRLCKKGFVNHHCWFAGCRVWNIESFQTPLTRVVTNNFHCSFFKIVISFVQTVIIALRIKVL